MFKSRTTSPNYGDLPTPKYYASSSGGYLETNQTFQDFIASLQARYYEGRAKAATTASLVTGEGSESITSSCFGRPRFNSCVHSKTEVFNFPYLLVTKSWPETWLKSTQRYGWAQYWRYNRAVNISTILSTANVVPQWGDPALDAMQRRAWWSMQPRFESEISMLNFIYELKDFRSLAENLIKMARGKSLQNLWSIRQNLVKWTKRIKHAKLPGTSPQVLSKTLADAWLEYQFAIRPLIDDLGAIFDILSSVITETQAEFARLGEDGTRSHYSEPIFERYSGTWGSNSSRIYFTGRRDFSRFTATYEYKFDYELRKGWGLIQRVWGLEVNAEVVWNALPFTFLVDYFYKIGKSIRNMQLDPNVHVTHFQYCESLTSEFFYGVGLNASDSLVHRLYMPAAVTKSDESLKGFIPLTGAKLSHFDRRPTSPNRGMATPRVGGPSKTQLYNIAALIRSIIG